MKQKLSKIKVLDDDLIDEIVEGEENWLILTPSTFKGFWTVVSIDPSFFFDFQDIIGPYSIVSPATLPQFQQRCIELDQKYVFDEDPSEELERWAHLNDPPAFSINSDLEGTIQGMFPWQIRGFNKLIKDESLRGGLVLWATGTGKTAFIASAIKWHQSEGHPFQLALVVVKSINKADTKRKLMELGDIESVIIDGSTPTRRRKVYDYINSDINFGKQVVAITNYEKFREDEDYFKLLVEDRDVLFFWDEMPTRLRTRGTKLYDAVGKTLFRSWRKTDWARKRPRWMRSWELTATPIENAPEDQFSCLRLIDPDAIGTWDHFKEHYAAAMNFFRPWEVEDWTNLDHLGLTLDHMIDQVDRDDPQVANLFPEVMEDEILIDWNPKFRKIYDVLTGKAIELLSGEDFSEDNILAILSVMQMICDAPSMITLAASRREEFMKELQEWVEENHPETDSDWAKAPDAFGSEVALKLIEGLGDKEIVDTGHTKLDALKEILIEKHPDEKALVFMTWNSYGLPIVSKYLDEWGISHVVYSGTDKQRQEAKDKFRSDPSIRVFLSSDAGSDSIDLPEASVSINYNLPYKWTTKRQRRGRLDRVNSEHKTAMIYDLLMENSVENRKKAIIDKKHAYHTDMFEGTHTAEDTSITREDYWYMLTGD